MCGFIGVISDDLGIKADEIEEAKDILRHRGPDRTRYYKNDNVFLLHNRLAVIDLSEEADQPMIDNATGNVLVFNGEIYNYKILKSEHSDIKWETDSDSEVILKLYSKIGTRFIEELNGIFSFVIYDRKRNKVLLCRDRFGVKPLYYSQTGNTMFAASEIKGILYFKDGEINHGAIYDYLEYGTVASGKRTFFNDIYSLEPAHFAEYDIRQGRMNISRYWDVPDGDESPEASEGDVIDKVYSLMKDGVRLNMVSDVEVAISLSSGTDSALLLNFVRLFQNKMKAYTFGFEEEMYDEVRAIRNNMDLSGIEHHPVYFKKKDLFSSLEEAVYYFEVPLGGLGALCSYNMMKEVHSNKIKVMLSGEGSDEVFGGYQYYYYAFFRDIEGSRDFLNKELSYYSAKHGVSIKPFSEKYNTLLKLIDTKKVLAPDATGADFSYAGCALKKDFAGEFHDLKSRYFKSNLREIMYRDLTIKKLPKLLHFQDRASMASAVETRVPYLDHNLVSFIYKLAPGYKIRGGETKYLIRKILKEKFNFGENRKVKHYVSTPQREWLKDKIVRDRILDIIRNGKLVRDKLIDYGKFSKDYISYSESPEPGNSFFVWKMINLEYLMKQKWPRSNRCS